MKRARWTNTVRGVVAPVAAAIAADEDAQTLARLAIKAGIILASAWVFGTAVRIFLVTSGFGG